MLISEKQCSQFSDQEIILKALDDIDFFSCLYQRYEARLNRYIRRISEVSNEEAEDILQEVFIKVWKSLRAIDSSLKVSSWLYRIVYNEVVSRWRKNKRSGNNLSLELNEAVMQNLTDDLEMDATNELLVNEALQKISEKYRQVLILKYFEEMSYEEISDVLKIPEGTVATRLNRAKQALEIQTNKKIIG